LGLPKKYNCVVVAEVVVVDGDNDGRNDDNDPNDIGDVKAWVDCDGSRQSPERTEKRHTRKDFMMMW
jgi:hypothetical protein